jgi:hypothetical protein
MKKACLSAFITAVLCFGCSKSDNSIPYATSKNYPVAQTTYSPGGSFSFTGIDVNPSTIKIGKPATLVAKATGTNLTFTWSTSHGDLFGSGSSIYYSDSCVGTYTVTCTVSDGTHSSTITVSVTVSS